MSLSNEQIEEFKEAFNLFDKEGNGVVEGKEIGSILRALGINPTETELQDMMNEIQDKENGLLTFNSFLNKITKKLSEEEDPEDIINSFRVFDREGQGFVSSGELHHIMTTIGEALTKEEADQMIQEADPNGTGKIYYEEFVDLMLAK
ncbi:calmodulin-1 [Anaeramoeba flamelloides]|uniref:Calmodulin-1 n=1 Tax=Anaeramoeba flamelloides TaxID=1746091 RepID=A0AAV7ZVX9_9EUKA|nr:calmodulin-1 [Anaeramoeba flamelloides]KAJ3426548.1 calmodulin-1 [Anaeramoeba flamelloides]KAJ3438950.1 calmodulin-1 [Anaeramoeba flamelloides]KAJ3438959.1 calmodulin-1 [Anaeramoeba flamelloides]KAJ3444163.1 calmodulin-1 [Anaeramoeba flamelloides]